MKSWPCQFDILFSQNSRKYEATTETFEPFLGIYTLFIISLVEKFIYYKEYFYSYP